MALTMAAEIDIEAQTGDDAGEAVVAQWFYADGADVAAGSIVCTIMVEKAAYDVAAPASGKLVILAPPDAVVQRGAAIGRIRRLA
jgi:pyruvate/2-oxoglutarate dehydrogenase complex dihydrolipoamide acyltransferase (E2) component